MNENYQYGQPVQPREPVNYQPNMQPVQPMQPAMQTQAPVAMPAPAAQAPVAQAPVAPVQQPVAEEKPSIIKMYGE